MIWWFLGGVAFALVAVVVLALYMNRSPQSWMRPPW